MIRPMDLLVVDDSRDMCEMLATVLSQEGYNVETAGTGREAVAKFKAQFFNAMLIDVRLPDMDGTELLRILKEINPDAEGIMVTAYATIESSIRAVNHGAAGYILKPFELNEVVAVVNRALEKQQLVFENRRLLAELERKNKELERMAITDGLTGLYNRRYFEQMLDVEDARLQRYHAEDSLIVVDINNLKHINDTLGHDKGDILIGATAQLLSQICRASDLVARYGGDEFVILMPKATREAATSLVERIREAASRWNPPDLTHGLSLNLAVGIATTAECGSLRKVLQQADSDMYRDKERYYRAIRQGFEESCRNVGG